MAASREWKESRYAGTARERMVADGKNQIYQNYQECWGTGRGEEAPVSGLSDVSFCLEPSAEAHLLPTRGICVESHPYQETADPGGRSRQCGYVSVCESPSVRMCRTPLLVLTTLFSPISWPSMWSRTMILERLWDLPSTSSRDAELWFFMPSVSDGNTNL
jgi:hypothetical protein